MDAYDTIMMPYYASRVPAPLPTLAEIVLSRDIIGRDDHRTIVRVGRHFLVKYGTDVDLNEAANMLFVRANCDIRIPKLYAAYREHSMGLNIIIMEFIRGQTIRSIFDRLRRRDREDIAERLRTYMRRLRRIPAGNFYGSLGNRPYSNPFWEDIPGPFNLGTEVSDAYFHLEFRREPNLYRVNLAAYRDVFDRITRDLDYPVFSHGDLHWSNILITDNDRIVIIDWERAAFYPAYYEYLVTAGRNHHIPERWREMARIFLGENHAAPTELLDEAGAAYYEGRQPRR
ncbi:phosphotransferase enzyme family protein [Whalleya microplaca]|nr:phosphotransferase enzyme family protein [Whalleya microplaca]